MNVDDNQRAAATIKGADGKRLTYRRIGGPAVLDQYVAHFEQIALVFRALQANIEAQMKSSREKRPQS